MTIGAVLFFMLLFFKWFPKVRRGCRGTVRGITFYFVAMVIVHTPAPILLLLDKQYYHLELVSRMTGNIVQASIMIVFFYHLLESLLLVICTCILKKWYWRLLPFAVSITVQSLLSRMNILVFENGWNLWYTLLIYEIFIGIYIFVEKYTLKP